MPITENIAAKQSPRRMRALRRIVTRVASGLRTCSQSYSAAALYQNLSQLSDAELSRRGLSRSKLASDVLERSLSQKAERAPVAPIWARHVAMRLFYRQEKTMRQNLSLYSVGALQIAILAAVLLWMLAMFFQDIMRAGDPPTSFADEKFLFSQAP